jgi:tetraacyldisaccharide 4'-kinase
MSAKGFELPIISVGNLALGGTGKTPHIEYLIRLLVPHCHIATLSRGYKRKTKGFYLSNKNATIEDIGDEPLQYCLKFKDITVAVDEKRVRGVEKLLQQLTQPEVILLDDAFQHRAIAPGLQILLTEYNNLYSSDYVIPSGRLREFARGSKRADLIIVTKSPKELSEEEKQKVLSQLNPTPAQPVYFSWVSYGAIQPFTKSAITFNSHEKATDIILMTGIAKPEALYEELSKKYTIVEHLKFADHHNFNSANVSQIKKAYATLKGKNKILITTEKDIMRLSLPALLNELQGIRIYYIPIEINFLGSDKKQFDKKILDYVAVPKRN